MSRDPCLDDKGNDVCHLARGAPHVDFTALPTLRRAPPPLPPLTPLDALPPPRTASTGGTRRSTGGTRLSTADATDSAAEGSAADSATALPFRMPARLRPNLAALPESAMQRANMVRASTEAYKRGFAAAQEYIDRSPSLRGWTVDRELSNRSSLVLERDGVTRIAYRGTQWSNVPDVVHNGQAFVFREGFSEQMQEAGAQIRRVRAKYGNLPSELLGYSRGGGMAMHLGDEFGIRTTTFNPFVSPLQLSSTSAVPHQIYRTTEDAVSSLLAFARSKRNYRVNAIHPIRGMDGPRDMHSLRQFTSAGTRTPGELEVMMRQGLVHGQQLAHLETLDAMANGVELGQTFADALDDFNLSQGARQRVDVTEDGRLGPRIHKGSGTVRHWKAAGGTFTAAEEEHLARAPVPNERPIHPEAEAMGVSHDPLTEAQIEHVASLTSEERAAFMQGRRAEMQEHHARMNASAQPHEAMVKAMMPRPTSVATGIVSGLAAHAIVSGIDPDNHLHPVVSEAVEGATAGAIGAGVASAVGASVALGPEMLAGAAGAVAGTETTKAVTGALERGGMGEEGAEAIGSVTGGGVGGLVSAVTAIGAGVATDLALGTELGFAAGGPLGAAIGAGVGFTVGAIAGGIGWLFGHAGRHEEPPP